MDTFRGWKILFAPPAIKRLMRAVKTSQPKVLDIGCGFGSVIRFKKYCPNCEYHGIDRDRRFLVNGEELLMHSFYEADLEVDPFTAVPEQYFDAILMSHVIEHLHNGNECVRRLVSKLKPGGVFYIEYPGVRSLRVPRARGGGFLHFHDDATHVRLYSIGEIVNTLLLADCEIISAGTRRDPLRLALSPFLAIRGIVTRGDLWSGRLWDLFGIAEFVIARKALTGTAAKE